MSELDEHIRDLIYDLEEIGGVTLHPDPETGEEDRPPTFSIGEDGHALIKAFVEEQIAALQRRVEWTKKRPDKPGWYWMQQDSEFPECVEIYDDIDEGLYIACQSFTARKLDDFLSSMEEENFEMRWAGPLEPPHEARG